MVDLTVSTPVKDEPKVEPGTIGMPNVARSLPLAVVEDVQITPNDISSSVTQSVTLGTESRSPDSTLSNVENIQLPTPATASPPAKIRRFTRQSTKENRL